MTSLARRWAEALAAHLTRPAAELLPTMTGLVERLLGAMRSTGVDIPAARRVGAALVELEQAGTEVLEQTVRVLSAGLPARTPGLLGELIGGICAGFTQGLAHRGSRPSGAGGEARIALWIAAVDGTILEVNEAYTELVGRSAEDIVGEPVCLLTEAPGVVEQVASGAADHVRVRGSWPGIGGTPELLDVTVTRVGDVAGADARLVGLIERVATETPGRARADRDPLTGLPHRAALFDALAAEPGSLVGLCYFDIDGFKAVNDTLGNDGGDEVLRVVAQRLDGELTRDGHMVARTGGDEFAVLVHGLPGSARRDGELLQRVSQRVLEIVRRPVQVAEHRVAVTASVGVVRRDRGREGAELMRAAGTTLSRAKKAGRNRVALFDADLHDHDVSRFAMIARMPRALADGEFSLQYQPLVRMDDGSLVGVEALARWTLPSGELIAPDRFVPLAEETGMIVPLGRWVLAEACRQAAAWVRDGGPRLIMSVNLAARQVDDPGIVETVARALDTHDLPPGTLQLELTESEVMGPTAGARATLEALAGLGVRLAIDDFGTGYSNLAYLRSLPVHALKLAGPFVTGTGSPEGSVDVEITSMLVGLAHALGLTVTAEAVETAEQAAQLRELGCDLGQGWHYSRAVGAGEVPALASRRLGESA